MPVLLDEEKPARRQGSHRWWIAVVPVALGFILGGVSWFQPVRIPLGAHVLEFGRFNVGHKLVPPGASFFPEGWAVTVGRHEVYRITWELQSEARQRTWRPALAARRRPGSD